MMSLRIMFMFPGGLQKIHQPRFILLRCFDQRPRRYSLLGSVPRRGSFSIAITPRSASTRIDFPKASLRNPLNSSPFEIEFHREDYVAPLNETGVSSPPLPLLDVRRPLAPSAY
jgi:hypothetical protein